MKTISIYTLLIIANHSFAQHEMSSFDYQEFSTDENIVYASNDSTYFQLSILDSSNISEIAVIIDSLLGIENSKGIYYLEIGDYNFQIVPYDINDGSKKVWVNGLSKKFDVEWRQKIIRPKGGGPKVFTFRYNLSTNEIDYYYFNSLY
jgi:hypothetical protein